MSKADVVIMCILGFCWGVRVIDWFDHEVQMMSDTKETGEE